MKHFPRVRRVSGSAAHRHSRHRDAGGYLLLELVLALMIFSLAVIGIAQSLHMSIQTAGILGRENDIRIALRSFLEEVRRKPLAELTQTLVDERLAVTFNSSTEELELKDRNGSQLRDLYKLRVVATFDDGAGAREEVAEVYLYKPRTQEQQQ